MRNRHLRLAPIEHRPDQLCSHSCIVTGNNGRTVTVETAWIVRPRSDGPELVTAFVKKEKKDA